MSIARALARTSTMVCVLLALLAGCKSALQGEVQHPKPGEKGSVDYCGNASSQEANCMACTAKPGCGFCSAPTAGAPICQPGVTGDDRPETCGAALSISSEGCDAPPPLAQE